MAERKAGLLGLLPQRQGNDRFAIRWVEDYFGTAAEPEYPIDVTKGVTITWKMLGNGPDPTLTVNNGQPVGDCFFAGWAHDRILAITLGKLSDTEPDANGVVTLYLAYDKGQDIGVILADALLWMYQQGYIDAFAPVQLNRVDAVMAQTQRPIIFGGALTDTDQQNFELTPPVVWSSGPSNPSNPQNGHCYLRIKKAAAVGNATIVTWGDEQEVDPSWQAACDQEAWLILTKDDQQEVGPVVWGQIIADLDALPAAHGIPVPAPVPSPSPAPTTPPAPPVTPSEPPNPAPAPDPLPQPDHPLPVDLLEWWAKVESWARRHGL